MYKKTLRPLTTIRDERQTFRGTTRIRAYARTRPPVTGEKAVPLSGAAPGRTKRTFLRGGFQPVAVPL